MVLLQPDFARVHFAYRLGQRFRGFRLGEDAGHALLHQVHGLPWLNPGGHHKDARAKPAFLETLGLKEPGLHAVARTAYALLDLITFLTAGEDECRAWTIKRGFKAPQAAGVIHTDFERGFIKAEVIWWEDLIKLGSEAACRANAKLALEGKEYVVRDGDVIHFKFNV